MALFAQPAQKARPKIGLVFSGGGAKGIAHIGVLKAMEKAGLRPDYITGTSMGSIIGGLYAIGYSANEIEQLVLDAHWDEILANQIGLNRIVMEEKPYYGRYVVELPTNNFKPKLPAGGIEGQNLDNLLSNLTRRVHNIHDFTQFPIPFACMAADITNGKLVVLNQGNLAKSMRASMAVPGVFTPVEIDGKLLVDGGLVHNFPVNEVKQMGADIVIGVYLGGELKDKKGLQNVVNILLQSSFIPSIYDAHGEMKKVDYLLEPNLTAFSAGNFSSAKQILAQGIKTGEQFYPVFQKLADSLNAFGTQAPLQILPQPDKYLVGSTSVTGNELLPAALITSKFNVKEKKYYTTKQLEEKISILFGRGYFDNIGYQLYGPDTAGYKVAIEVKETVPGKIKGAIHYDTENKAGVNLNYTLRNKLGKGSRLILEGDLAEFPRLYINYLKYLGNKQNAAVVADIQYNIFQPLLKDDANKKSVFSIQEFAYKASLISTYAANHNFGLDIGYSTLRLKPEAGEGITSVIDYIKTKEFSGRLYFKSNNLERRYFPRYGSSALVSVEYFLSSNGQIAGNSDSTPVKISYHIPAVKRLSLSYNKIFPLHKRVSVIATAGLTLANHDTSTIFVNSGILFVGGVRPRIHNSLAFYGANNLDYTVSSYMLGKLDCQFELAKKIYLTTGVNYINIRQPMEWLFKNYKQASDLYDGETWRLGYGASLGYMSIIGPVSFSVSADTKRKIFLANFALGFYF